MGGREAEHGEHPTVLERVGVGGEPAVGVGGSPGGGRAPHQERLPLQYGQAVTGTIDATQFFQQYTFNGQAGDVIVITMEALSGDLDPLLLLGDSQLNLIAENDDGGSQFDARLELVLPARGAYIVEATRYGQDTEAGVSQGDYRLTLTGNAPASGVSPRQGILAALAFGDTARGALSPQDPFHLFWFQANQGDEVQVQAMTGADIGAALFLYNSGFAPLGQDMTGRTLQAAIPADGVYFVALALQARSPGGAYAIALSGTATGIPETLSLPIQAGQRVEGTLSDARPVERYSFQGRANDQFVLRMEALDTALDPFVSLYGPGGEIIGQDDDSGGGANAELAVVLPVDGTYEIVATRFGRETGTSSGTYALSLIPGANVAGGAPVATPEAVTPIPAGFVGLPEIHYGDSIRGQIVDDYFKAYVFQASAGDEIVLTMERLDGDLDPMVVLLDAGLETVAEQDDIGPENQNARLVYTAPESGYYGVLATRYQGESGSTTGGFRLTLSATNVPEHRAALSLLGARPLEAVQAVEGQLDVLADVYQFAASAGDSIRLTLEASGGLDEQTVLVLADSSLNELAVSREGELVTTVLEDDLYALFVARESGPFGSDGGAYTLNLSGSTAVLPDNVVSSDAESYAPGSVLPYGAVVIDTLDVDVPELNYLFNGRTGDRISLTLDAIDPTLDPQVAVLDPEGNEVVRDNDSGGNLNALIAAYLLRTDGQYTIVASRRGASRGRFELVLDGAPVLHPDAASGLTGESLATAIPILAGQTFAGAITPDLSAVFYRFDGTAGTTVDISMVRMNEDLDAFLALLDPGQALVGMNDDGGGNQNARLVYTLPADGAYTIVATRYDMNAGTTSGEYLLSIVTR